MPQIYDDSSQSARRQVMFIEDGFEAILVIGAEIYSERG